MNILQPEKKINDMVICKTHAAANLLDHNADEWNSSPSAINAALDHHRVFPIRDAISNTPSLIVRVSHLLWQKPTEARASARHNMTKAQTTNRGDG